MDYMPPPEFQEDSYDQLVDLALSDSTELFLFQWPLHQHPEINGKEITLQLGVNGKLGSVTDSDGKGFDLVSCASQESEATVILSSAAESKIVGNISRRVSLVHYVEPEDYQKLSFDKGLMYQNSSGTLMTNSSNPLVTPMQSKLKKSSHSGGRIISTCNSRHKSFISGMSELSKPSKRKREESIGSKNQSTESHGTNSLEHSHQGRSKKKVKSEVED